MTMFNLSAADGQLVYKTKNKGKWLKKYVWKIYKLRELHLARMKKTRYLLKQPLLTDCITGGRASVYKRKPVDEIENMSVFFVQLEV